MEDQSMKQEAKEDEFKIKDYKVINQPPFSKKEELKLEESNFMKIKDTKQEIPDGVVITSLKDIKEVHEGIRKLEDTKEETKEEDTGMLLELVGAKGLHLLEKNYNQQEKYLETNRKLVIKLFKLEDSWSTFKSEFETEPQLDDQIPAISHYEVDTSFPYPEANSHESEDATTTVIQEDLETNCDEDFTCYQCDKEFPTALILKRHIVCHHNPNITCDVCDKKFNSKITLNDHIKFVHFKYTKCKICGQKISRTNLRKHENLHKNEYNFQCGLCNTSFKEKGGLKIHLTNVHSDEKKFKCNFCDKSFKNSSNRNMHITVHHNNNKEEKYVCDICSKGFYRELYLKRHYKIHTGEDKKIFCDICGLGCRSRTDMVRHMYTHTGGAEKPHKCNECKMAFIKASHLVRHQLVHSGTKPFECDQCDKSYKDPSSLKIHKKTVHDKSRFVCITCGKCLFNESSFKRHLRSQSCQPGKFEFECTQCGKNFKHKFSLTKHNRFYCKVSKEIG